MLLDLVLTAFYCFLVLFILETSVFNAAGMTVIACQPVIKTIIKLNYSCGNSLVHLGKNEWHIKSDLGWLQE